MEQKGSIDDIYRLLSDILRIAADYSSEIFVAAQIHVESSSKGIDRSALLQILKELNRLKNRGIPAEPSKPDVREKDDKGSAAISSKDLAPRGKSTKESILREIRAMLEDPEFLESKQALVKLIKAYFRNRVTIRSDNKDSKRDLTSKAINAFRQMTETEQHSFYNALRRAYLKDRKTGLGEWTEIITNSGDRE